MSDNGDNHLCDCCGKEPSIGVAAVPGMPVSIAWCRKCLDADVIPYDLLVANTAMIGGRDSAARWWAGLIERTLPYFEKNDAQFAVDVEKSIAALVAFGDPQENDNEGET